MDISSVTSRAYSPPQAPAEPKRPESKPDVVKADEQQPVEKKPPVVNMQGQTTGRIVNTAA